MFFTIVLDEPLKVAAFPGGKEHVVIRFETGRGDIQAAYLTKENARQLIDKISKVLLKEETLDEVTEANP
ncbi:hypothetical protein SAMN00808754_2072 [Thermanaeromonas toyohensis ToBE]|uniref:Uncharacterized protein n=1 Tax=Thermanaeromonas toyohensis ToBE TaxID=698762 RepID=A0A1W1VY34_9FIRM|nr:hypothetical protein [Thermanaeromonas toyohensis]SMB98001.1 hypothetical protein SAMN00808754_2072 [Thermanaeromonas toyohensis ToBE]